MNVDKERIRNLLTETVILLCKNGLKFSTDVKVQGLLGITLDNKDIILVQIDERICEPVNIDLLKEEDDDNASTRKQLQTMNFFEQRKQKSHTNHDWRDEHNALAPRELEVEYVNNDVIFQDSEVCSTFNNSVSLSDEQSVRILRSTSGSICQRKSEHYEELQVDSVPHKQQNSELFVAQSVAHLPVIVSCRTITAGKFNKSSRLVHNRSQGLSETTVSSELRKSKIKLLRQRTDKFSPPLIYVNPAMPAALSAEYLLLEGIDECLYNTTRGSSTIQESPICHRSFSPTGSLPPIHKNQSHNAQLSEGRPARFRRSRNSIRSYASHENLENLFRCREQTRLRVRKHRLKKKLELLAIKNEAS